MEMQRLLQLPMVKRGQIFSLDGPGMPDHGQCRILIQCAENKLKQRLLINEVRMGLKWEENLQILEVQREVLIQWLGESHHYQLPLQPP